MQNGKGWKNRDQFFMTGDGNVISREFCSGLVRKKKNLNKQVSCTYKYNGELFSDDSWLSADGKIVNGEFIKSPVSYEDICRQVNDKITKGGKLLLFPRFNVISKRSNSHLESYNQNCALALDSLCLLEREQF